MKAVKRLGGEADSGIKSEGDFCLVEIVVNRLGHGDQPLAFLRKHTGDRQRTIAADRDERVNVMQTEDEATKNSRLSLVAAAKQTIENALRLLDIQAPDVM